MTTVKDTITCPNCGHVNPVSALFCQEDGFSLHEGDTDDPLVGRLVGNYRLLERKGEGGFGVVYHAIHRELKTQFAVKILHPQFSANQHVAERFRREALAAGKLRHENVVHIADFGHTKGIGYYYAMEYLEGRTLKKVIDSREPLSSQRILHIAQQVTSAMQHVHAKKIIHRDLKPENIFLIEKNGVYDYVKLVDFGIAKILDDESSASLTRTGLSVGTPLYMSPEQARGKLRVLDHRTDIYSWGIILFEMLTGEPPFFGENPHDVVMLHIRKKPPRLEEKAPNRVFRSELQELIDSMIAKKPEERPASMRESLDFLEQILALPNVIVKRDPTQHKKPPKKGFRNAEKADDGKQSITTPISNPATQELLQSDLSLDDVSSTGEQLSPDGLDILSESDSAVQAKPKTETRVSTKLGKTKAESKETPTSKAKVETKAKSKGKPTSKAKVETKVGKKTEKTNSGTTKETQTKSDSERKDFIPSSLLPSPFSSSLQQEHPDTYKENTMGEEQAAAFLDEEDQKTARIQGFPLEFLSVLSQSDSSANLPKALELHTPKDDQTTKVPILLSEDMPAQTPPFSSHDPLESAFTFEEHVPEAGIPASGSFPFNTASTQEFYQKPTPLRKWYILSLLAVILFTTTFLLIYARTSSHEGPDKTILQATNTTGKASLSPPLPPRDRHAARTTPSPRTNTAPVPVRILSKRISRLPEKRTPKKVAIYRRLHLHSSPKARLFINQKYVGKTPFKIKGKSGGAVRIRLERRGYKTYEWLWKPKRNRTRTVRLRLLTTKVRPPHRKKQEPPKRRAGSSIYDQGNNPFSKKRKSPR